MPSSFYNSSRMASGSFNSNPAGVNDIHIRPLANTAAPLKKCLIFRLAVIDISGQISLIKIFSLSKYSFAIRDHELFSI